MLWLDNQEVNEEIEPVEIVEDENLNIISTDLKELLQFMKDEKIEKQEIAEAEKKIQIEAEKLQIELDEQERIKNLEEKELIEKKEQELIDSEIEFRENLMTDLKETNLKLDEVITYNSKSDGFSDDIALVPQKLDLIVENTQQTETQQNNDNIANFADVAMIGLVVVILPIYVVYRFFKAILSPLL